MAADFTPRQTNIALYVQLHEAGYSNDELLEVRHVYRLACKLFNGRYRKTEKAFICHVVGAASSVAHFDGNRELTLAALLHAAYDGGLFPDGRIGGATPAHRAWLLGEVRAEVEELVFRYASFDFEKLAPERILANGAQEFDPECLLLALTHEVDDLADCGLAFAPKYGAEVHARVAACAELAMQIGKPALAETLRKHATNYQDLSWLNGLQSQTLQGYHIATNLRGYARLRRHHFRGSHVELH
jgi:hypothetical protein